MSAEPAARFFVNSGIVSGRVDMYHLLRPLLKQTVTYRYFRGGHARHPRHRLGGADRGRPAGRLLVLHAAVDLHQRRLLGAPRVRDPTRPALAYTLVQGDERVVLEFAPTVHGRGDDEPVQQSLRLDPLSQYIQMELSVADATDEPSAAQSARRRGRRTTATDPASRRTGLPV